jgi:hypothetical protein
LVGGITPRWTNNIDRMQMLAGGHRQTSNKLNTP